MALPPLPLRERRVFVDSSAYLALLDTDDEHHREAITTLQELAQARYRQFTAREYHWNRKLRDALISLIFLSIKESHKSSL